MMCMLAIQSFQASTYCVLYEFVGISSSETWYQVMFKYIGVISDFGIYFIALVVMFNFITYSEVLSTNVYVKNAKRSDDNNLYMVFLYCSISFVVFLLICYIYQTLCSFISSWYFLLMFSFAMINPLGYYHRDSFIAFLHMHYSELLFDICNCLCFFCGDLLNKSDFIELDGEDQDIYNAEFDAKTVYEIDEIQKEISQVFDFTNTILRGSFDAKEGEERKKERVNHYKLKTFVEMMWDNGKDTIEESKACLKLGKMWRECNMLGCNEYDDEYGICNQGAKGIIYKVLLAVFVLIGQVANIYYFVGTDNENAWRYILLRFCLLKSAMDYNIFDVIINCKRTKKVIGSRNHLACYGMLGFYLVGVILSICILVFTHVYDMPNIEYVNFIKDDNVWERNNNTKNDVPGFCSTSGLQDSYYKVDDFAFMTTLPRLYTFNNNSCFIKPKLRGVFNSTMKYIFGGDYTQQGIKIYCYPYSHDPYLVITSEKMFEEVNETITNHSDYEIFHEEKVIDTKPYFDVNTLCDDGIAIKECNILKTCINDNPGTQCEYEWSNYTNAYWNQYPSDDKRLSEYENYEITIPTTESEAGLNESEKFGFYPRLKSISNNETTVTAQHFIVGGCFEDIWGYSYQAEIVSRTYFPMLFSAIIPFFSIFQTILPIIFSTNELFNGIIMGTIRKQDNENKTLINLIDRFKFNMTNAYTIGHSISAATMKGVAATVSIPGVAFETKSTNVLSIGFEDIIDNVGTNRLNVYSKGNYVSSEDDKYDANGVLPELFFNPNVYDTACLTTVVCSRTKKYVPLCKQVLTQHGEDPEKKFQDIIDAYNKKHTIQDHK